MSALTFVKTNVANNKVFVLSKSTCPYCAKAKAAIGRTGISPSKVTIIEIDGRPDMDQIQDAAKEITGGRSVPRVFVGGKFIGGGDDTDALERSGKLKEMFAAEGLL